MSLRSRCTNTHSARGLMRISDMRSFYASNKNLEEGPLIACVPFKKASSANVVLSSCTKECMPSFRSEA